jgi:tetratricopeptide (TPR) repeat protein
MKKQLSIPLILLLLVIFLFVYLRKNNKVSSLPIQNKKEVSEKDREEINNFWSHQRKATSHRIAGEWAEAKHAYIKALAMKPAHENSLYHLGNMYLELKQYDSAALQWTLLLQNNQNSARGHFQLGNLHFNPQNRAYYNLNIAKKEFETTFEINKDFMQPALQLGHLYLIEGNIPEAMKYYQLVIGSNRDNSEAYLLLAYAYFKVGSKKEALTTFEKAVSFANTVSDSSVASSEGDTKDGVSMQRETNFSPFYYITDDLSNLETSNLAVEMEKKYDKLDILISSMSKDASN